jgi:hypothetical protein
MRLFHPATYFATLFVFPFFYWFNKDSNEIKALQEQDSVSSDDTMENADLEGFAEVKPAMDENIFEIYDRLTIHDNFVRSKTFRRTIVMKPMKQETREMGGDIAPSSVDEDISRESEESKSDICAICKESKEQGQHIVMSF